MNKVNKKVNINDKKIVDKLNNFSTTKSKVLYLLSMNFTRSEIERSKLVLTKSGNPLRYQHIRNIEVDELGKRAREELSKVSK